MEASNWFWIAAAIIILALDAWLINSVWRSTKSTGTKTGWAILILALPIVGAVIWGIAGPRGVAEAPTSPDHSKG
jgi:hypothetical protein